MVNKTDNEAQNKYIQARFAQMKNLQRGDAHTVKKGESLWNIAKGEIGSRNAAEISEYMLSIAKVNGFDTVEKMNSIKANTVIYMPKSNSKPKPAEAKTSSQQQKVATPKTTTTPVQKHNPAKSPTTTSAKTAEKSTPKPVAARPNPGIIKPQPVRTPAEQLVNKTIGIILDKNNNVKVRKVRDFGDKYYYQVLLQEKNKDNISYCTETMIMSYSIDEKQNVTKCSFHERQGESPFSKRIQYDIDKKGNIIKSRIDGMICMDNSGTIEPVVGKVANTNLQQIYKMLINKASQADARYASLNLR